MQNSNKNIAGGNLYPPVNCSNDFQMVNENLRVPKLFIDHSEFIKSIEERKQWKLKKNKMRLGRGSNKSKDPSIEGKLTVYLKNTKKNNKFHTTITIMVKNCDINNYLTRLKDVGEIINKVYYNKKLYYTNSK